MKSGTEEVFDNSLNELRLSRPDTGGQSTLGLTITTTTYSLQNLTRTFTLLFQ